MTALLEVRGLGKSYPGTVALHPTSLWFNAGEITGIMGKNGAGKSTLIRLIAGAESPSVGCIMVDGRPVRFSKTSDAAAAGVAVVHQELSDLPRATVAENVLLGDLPRRAGQFIDGARRDALARAALDRVGLATDPRSRLADLSVADRRLVMIARALRKDARILILDEPTASLNEPEIARLHDLLRVLRGEGRAILYITHRMQEVDMLCDRVVVLRDGHLVADGPIDTCRGERLISIIAGQSLAQKSSVSAAAPLGARLTLENLDPFATGEPFELAVRRGEVLGLTGLAGAGRTELFEQIMGLGRSTVTLRETDERIELRSPRAAVAAGVSIVPEDRRGLGIIAPFDLAGNITAASMRRSRLFRGVPLLSRRIDHRRGGEMIARLGIRAIGPSAGIGSLSGGNQQKAIIARSLTVGSRLLLLDEPTHGVDVDAKAEIYGLVRKAAADGVAVILVSSDLPELERLADRVVVLANGRPVAELTGPDIAEKTMLRHASA
ncbi:hypothetical protein B7H23_04145 [Notoacmeibacter marinus]|uniref:ABC transporter domain-containing protein n=1 Tax=Notoacmeibacter marinus TaxID=1876515 RepID=A0A231V261_9HYPH|nr:sugar ABC transporter ATP-binding protein [Notoacmeibacter marinus]OXT02121.1 hypothetical protein B7H23_04145 [Notoacmeibacter marinus]